MESYISLDNIQFYANHGVFEQEALVGNSFVVNLKIKIDITEAVLTDSITNTVSYASVYGIVNEEMKVNSNLIEHVAGRIIFALKKAFPQIKQIELKLSKMNPPVGGQVESASILIID